MARKRRELTDDERHAKAIDAEHKSARWLSKGREAEERGDREKAEVYFEKSEYWLTRANAMRRW